MLEYFNRFSGISGEDWFQIYCLPKLFKCSSFNAFLLPNTVLPLYQGDLRFVVDIGRYEILGTEDKAPRVKCLPYKPEDLSSICSTHMKSQAHWHTGNPSAREAEAGRFLELPASQIGEPRVLVKDSVSKNKVAGS